MNKKIITLFLILTMVFVVGYGQNTLSLDLPIAISDSEKNLSTQWDGKRVAYLGDSMTQKWRDGTSVYWEYLVELLGIEPYVYGISGHQWGDIYDQAVKLYTERGTDIDAIFIFAGTNDYNHNIPLGEFYSETSKETNHNGEMVIRRYRVPIINDITFCGRINKVMSYLKDHFPQQQIIVMTPIHRAFAKFNETNVQPEESFANGQGLFLDTYVNTLREASSHWAVPLIDLYTISGFYPLTDAHAEYFKNSERDRLHLSDEGNYRLAKTIQYQLLAFPSTFVNKK